MKRKKDYPTTDETHEVLNGNEISIAKAYPCSPSYIYNIKNMEEPDPYAPFREWFQTCAFGGAPAEVYLHDLAGILFRAQNGVLAESNLHFECLKSIDRKAGAIQQLARIIEDGKVDESECDIILRLCHSVETDIKRLKNLALNFKNKREQKREIGRSYGLNGAAKTAKVTG